MNTHDTPPVAPTSTVDPLGTLGTLSAEDLARLLSPGPQPGRGSLRRKLLFATLFAAIGIGASIMSCVGQSFSYRQASALEGIEQHLRTIEERCTAEKPR